MTRLTKRDVEALLDRYDADAIGALSTALAKVLGSGSGSESGSWPELVAAAHFDPRRTSALLAARPDALDALAAELNELRELGPR